MLTIITAECLFTPVGKIESPVVVVEDGQIRAAQPSSAAEIPAGRRLDFPGMVLAPGFIDIHIHGGAGHDVMDAGENEFRGFEQHLLRHGVTAYLPTTVTADHGRTLTALDRIAHHIETGKKGQREMALGIHLEGPFISHAKRGVHPPQHLLSPSPQHLQSFWEASRGTLRIMTIAPELDGAAETIAHGAKLGIHSSLGHSDATYSQACSGIRTGADHATHTFNAMRQLEHREPGIAGAVLDHVNVSADIIADGIHVHPAVVSLFLRAKGQERAVLITDAISATGMPDGVYALGGLEVEVKEGRCEYDGRLAGSVLTMDRAVRNVMQFAGWTLQDSIRLATLNPVSLLSLSNARGMIAPGRRADLVVLTREGEVAHTILAGNVVH
jgi:N-acetylglucosamine-6-phosphate deacetylase